MVWGVAEPNSFGDFFPNGDYVGWEEGIKRYFDEEMSAEQRAAHDNRDVSYRRDVSRKFTEDMGPLEPHECPSEFRMMEARKWLGSLILLTNRLLAVDATLKEMIETLEPGVHQFWPLRITLRNDNEYPGPHYGMVIRRFIDSFVPEQSDVRQAQGRIQNYLIFLCKRSCKEGLRQSDGFDECCRRSPSLARTQAAHP